jgi:hypothetical protein
MVPRPAILCIILFTASYADDIYLMTGFVLRNVQVMDTTNSHIKIVRDGRISLIDTSFVLSIDRREVLSKQKSSYEIFSQDLHEQYQRSLPEKEAMEPERKQRLKASRRAAKAELLERMEAHLDSTHTWRKSIYIAGGWGIPQGARFELGYNFQESIALALSFGIHDSWSNDPAEGTLAILGSLRFPVSLLPVTPYLLICTGGTLATFGGQDTYTLIYVGTMVELSSGIHLRPEFGLAFTSKHISGGTSLFGGTSPEIKEDKTRFGANVTLEIDLAHIF